MNEIPSPEFLVLQEAVVGRYSLDRELGRGGMGIVFLARDVALDRPVAIKLFPPELARDTSRRERFLHEARTAAKLSHPNIVPIHSVEEHDELVFFVMTFVEGETLTERVASKGPLNARDAVTFIRDVAWALSHAHGQGVIHRDIKPDNIMLDGGTGRAIVTDFGIAKRTDVVIDSDEHEVVGTPEFMSPEQASGEVVDGRSDIYSLGVVAFFALAGKYPFNGSSPAELLAHHIRTPAPKLHTVAPGVPSKLSALVERCMAKAPDDRVASAQQLEEILRAAAEERRELPVPVRIFIDQTTRNHQRRFGAGFVFFGFSAGWMLVRLGVTPWLAIGGTALTAVSILATLVGPRVRVLLKAGYDRADVVNALNINIAKRHEELAFLYGADFEKKAKKLKKIAIGALAISVASIVGIAAGPAAPSLALSLGSLAVAIGATVIADRRSDRLPKRVWKFWKGVRGRWVFRFFGIGIKPAPSSPALTNRPTEIAVGMAIAGLYESLPKETRVALPDLQNVVQRLELDAQRMRQRMDELANMLNDAGTVRTDPALETEDTLEGQRYRAARRIREAKEVAEQRHRDAVAALEIIRVDLLRMQAGTADVQRITTNLGDARELAEDIQRLLEGHREIGELLSER